MIRDSYFVFFGTSRFSVIVLDELTLVGFVPSLIVTAPDRPAGRGQRITPSPVKLWAQKQGVPFLQPEKLDSSLLSSSPLPTTNYSFAILASYGLIIPRALTAAFPRGILNVHPSLLPHYRGPSPVQSHILADDQNVGVTIMLLDEKTDHGPIIAQTRLPPTPYSRLPKNWPPRASELEDLLAHEGGKLLADTLPGWLAGDIAPREQDHARATYTKKFSKKDGEITLDDVAQKPYETLLKIRAYDPWPGTYFFADKNGTSVRVKITDAVFKDGVLTVTRVIPEGGREMDYEAFSASLTRASKDA